MKNKTRETERIIAMSDYGKKTKLFFTESGIYAYGPKKEVSKIGREPEAPTKVSRRKKSI